MRTLLQRSAILVAGLLFTLASHATVKKVSVANFSFTPSNFTVSVGDTVEWDWVAGTHTTTSLTIPGGAASWNNPMSSSSTIFQYKVTVAGTYNYWCAIHTTSMEGAFTVTPAGVQLVNSPSGVFAVLYPNPASSVLNINLFSFMSNTDLTVTDILGRQVDKETLSGTLNTVNVSTWKKGIYFYTLQHGQEVMKGKFEIQ